MKILIYSKNPLTEVEQNKIKGIIAESHCPNESLKNTFNRFSFMQGDSFIYFDDVTIQNRHEALCTELEVWGINMNILKELTKFFIKSKLEDEKQKLKDKLQKQIITTTSTSVLARNVAYLGIIDKLDGKGIAEVNKIIDKI